MPARAPEREKGPPAAQPPPPAMAAPNNWSVASLYGAGGLGGGQESDDLDPASSGETERRGREGSGGRGRRRGPRRLQGWAKGRPALNYYVHMFTCRPGDDDYAVDDEEGELVWRGAGGRWGGVGWGGVGWGGSGGGWLVLAPARPCLPASEAHFRTPATHIGGRGVALVHETWFFWLDGGRRDCCSLLAPRTGTPTLDL